MSSEDNALPAHTARQGDRQVPRATSIRLETVLALVSALTYTGASLALRELAIPNDIGWAVWVTANKAVPAAIVAWALVGWRAARGLPALPPRRLLVPLLLVGLIMQYGGNLMFQWSLSLSGLAITVPIVFATLVCSGAWLGRQIVGDSITNRMRIAIGVMIVSIVLLSTGVDVAVASVAGRASTLTLVLAVATAMVSGFSYGAVGVMIRKLVAGGLSVSASLVMFSTAGAVFLGLHSVIQFGPDVLWTTSSAQWRLMLTAGVCNAIAFFSLAVAMKRASVTYLNVLIASQSAMCAAAGVLLFHEPFTLAAGVGCLLTVIGLTIVDDSRNDHYEEPPSGDRR